jgi:hypothetical protein
MENNGPYKMDYVYKASETDYRNVRVNLAVGEDFATVTVVPETPMAEDDLGGLIKYIETDVFKKARIDLKNDCRIVLEQDGKNFDVELSEAKPRIIGIKQRV